MWFVILMLVFQMTMPMLSKQQVKSISLHIRNPGTWMKMTMIGGAWKRTNLFENLTPNKDPIALLQHNETGEFFLDDKEHKLQDYDFEYPYGHDLDGLISFSYVLVSDVLIKWKPLQAEEYGKQILHWNAEIYEIDWNSILDELNDYIIYGSILAENNFVNHLLVEAAERAEVQNIPPLRVFFKPSYGCRQYFTKFEMKLFNIFFDRGVCRDGALNSAIKNGEHKLVELLLQKAEINVPDGFGNYPLHDAAVRPRHKDYVCQLLLERGAKVEVFNRDGVTPLVCAVTSENYETTKLLLKYGANVHTVYYGGSDLLSAIRKHVKIRNLGKKFIEILEKYSN